MATILEPVPASAVATLADLVRDLGDVSLERIRLHPPPGTATEQDVIAAEARDNSLCELVDGVLVEKPVGFLESRLAVVLIHFLETFLDRRNWGIVTGADGMLRLAKGLVRIPDVSFIRWEKFPGRKLPTAPIPDLSPDLAVEVLSPSNTRREMQRKLREYFAAGASLVWLLDPKTRSVSVYTAVDVFTVVDEQGTLDGGNVLPGFTLAVKDWFARAERQGTP